MQFEKIFFIHGRQPEIDSIMEQQLRTRFEIMNSQGLQCADASPYFKEVSVYR
jgi:hypothetical protein